MKNENIIIVDNNKIEEVNLFNENYKKIIIDVNDNSSLVVNYFNDKEKISSEVLISVGTNSSIIFNHSFINKNEYVLNALVKYKGSKSNIIVSIAGINDGGISNISIDGVLDDGDNSDILEEKIKLININGGKTISKPNMYISTSNIIANHENSIGNVNQEELFYLMSKGLSKENASKIICNGFLVSIYNNKDFKDKIKEYLSGR